MLRNYREARSGAESNSGIIAEAAVKQNVASLLGRLVEEVEADSHSGSNYLSLYLASTDEETGLSKGLLLVTDRTYGDDDRAVYKQPDGGFNRSYCVETMDCVFIEELSPGNLNVKTLDWDLRNGPLCRRSEEGLVGLSMRDVMGGKRGWLTRAALAPYFGVGAEDLLLGEGNATPADVDAFFGEILAHSVLDEMKPISFIDAPTSNVG